MILYTSPISVQNKVGALFLAVSGLAEHRDRDRSRAPALELRFRLI